MEKIWNLFLEAKIETKIESISFIIMGFIFALFSLYIFNLGEPRRDNKNDIIGTFIFSLICFAMSVYNLI